MAVAKASSEPKKSMVIVMALFVVLFLAAAAAAVVMFMGQSQLVSERDSARDQLAQIANSSQVSEMRGLPGGPGPAMSRVTEDMQAVASMAIGDGVSGTSLGEIRGAVEISVDPVIQELGTALVEWQNRAAEIKQLEIERLLLADPTANAADLAGRVQGLSLIGAEQVTLEYGLSNIVSGLVDQASYLMQQLKIVQQNARQDAEVNRATLAGIEGTIATLSVDRDSAVLAAKEHLDKYNEMVVEMTTEKDREIASLQVQRTQLQELEQAERQKNAELTQDIEEFTAQVLDLRQRLAQFQPNPEMEMAAFELDGVVTDVVPQEKTAYVNLGKDDHIYRGLTFTVYDRYQPFPDRETGKGIGTLEVIEIMNTISRCRIVDFNEANPIMQNDVIANVVWAKDKKYSFCVTGDFDFNGDGFVDTDGLGRIVSLIEQWGGEVTSTVSVNTDFMVLGQKPEDPELPADEFTVSLEELQAQFEREQARVAEYDVNFGTGTSLGVPTFNRDRFLHFIGYYSQATGGK
ncbi:MAG: hypothetical protein GY869_27565 [Planctomycetes bacterium]|nr:hypothetical protein [Planctomycetota bacterium]